MTTRLFELAFLMALPFWILIIVVPGWAWTKRIISSPWIVLAPLAVYFITVAPILGPFAGEMLQPDLAGVQSLLSTPRGTATAWAHLIAFDLFIGRWIYLDSRERRIHPLIMAPLFILTILLSPFGLVAYLTLRATFTRVRTTTAS